MNERLVVRVDLVGIVVFDSVKLGNGRVIPRLINHGTKHDRGRNRPAPAFDERDLEQTRKTFFKSRTIFRVLMFLLQPKIHMMVHALGIIDGLTYRQESFRKSASTAR